MFADTITFFNKYDGASGTTWFPHVLHNTQLIKDKAVILAKYGQDSQDKASLIINCSTKEGAVLFGDTTYKPPKEWERQVNDDLPNTITFKDDDFFVEGEIEFDGPILDEEYTDGFYAYARKNYDFCYKVTSVGGLYKLIPHFEILGR